MVAIHSAKHDEPLTVDERRSTTPVAENSPHRRFYDSKLNQMKIPIFLGVWLVIGLVVLGYMLL